VDEVWNEVVEDKRIDLWQENSFFWLLSRSRQEKKTIGFMAEKLGISGGK